MASQFQNIPPKLRWPTRVTTHYLTTYFELLSTHFNYAQHIPNSSKHIPNSSKHILSSLQILKSSQHISKSSQHIRNLHNAFRNLHNTFAPGPQVLAEKKERLRSSSFFFRRDVLFHVWTTTTRKFCFFARNVG